MHIFSTLKPILSNLSLTVPTRVIHKNMFFSEKIHLSVKIQAKEQERHDKLNHSKENTSIALQISMHMSSLKV